MKKTINLNLYDWRTREYGIKTIEATRVYIHEKIETYAHRDLDAEDHWRITEYKTGQMIDNGIYKTRKAAIDGAQETLKRFGIDVALEQIKTFNCVNV